MEYTKGNREVTGQPHAYMVVSRLPETTHDIKLIADYYNNLTAANLIAAAPDMYEALVALYDWVLNLPDDAMMHVLKAAPMNKSASAIAKAEGTTVLKTD